MHWLKGFLLLLALQLPLQAAMVHAGESAEAGNAAADARQAMLALDRYLDAVNRMDLQGVTDEYHFPHFRVVGVEFVVWDTPLDAMPMLALPEDERQQALAQALGDGWHRTDWGEREVVSQGPGKVHIATELIRLRADGSVINRFESLYVVTYDNGRWGIRGRSSFAPL